MSEGVLGTVVLVGAIGSVLVRIAWRDAKRCRVAWIDVLVLAGLGVAWRGIDDWSAIGLGALLGMGGVGGQIVLAKWRGVRQPVYAGDVMLMSASGVVLGPLGLSVSWLLNLPAGIGYRWWLWRKRGERNFTGYAPVAPAYCPAAGMVLLWQAMTGPNQW